MTTGRILLVAVFLSTVAGCAQPGPIQSHLTSVGSLKTTISHLEYENQQLQKQVADLEVKNRDIGDRLVQEESARDELASNLDNAKKELRKRGVELGGAIEPAETDESESPKTLPAGQSSKKKRKTPFARIPGRIEEIPPADAPPGDAAGGSRDSGSKGERLEFGPQSRADSDGPWQPVARAAGTASPQ